jgi:hypothetical protein
MSLTIAEERRGFLLLTLSEWEQIPLADRWIENGIPRLSLFCGAAHQEVLPVVIERNGVRLTLAEVEATLEVAPTT